MFGIGYVLLGITVARAGVLLALGGPVVAFSAPIGVLAVIAVGQALFGAGLAWAGYALWAGRGTAKG